MGVAGFSVGLRVGLSVEDTEGLGDDNGDFIPGVVGVGVGLPVAGINVGTFVGNSVAAGKDGAVVTGVEDGDGVGTTAGVMVGDEVSGATVGAPAGALVTGARLGATGAGIGNEVTGVCVMGASVNGDSVCANAA